MPEPQDAVDINAAPPPPSGDSQRAEKYVTQLIGLISQTKLLVEHTDLSKYDPSSLHDHYRVDIQAYQVEFSHSKQPLTGKDSYVLLFNNLQNNPQDHNQKTILAYLILTAEQFKRLQDVADEQIETRKKIEEAKLFEQAIDPVDKVLEQIAKGEIDTSKKAQPIPEIEAGDSSTSIPAGSVEEPAEEPETHGVDKSFAPMTPASSSVLDVMSKQAEPPQTHDQIVDHPAEPSTQIAEVPPSEPAPPVEAVSPPSRPPAEPVAMEDIQNALQQAAQTYQPPQIGPSPSMAPIGNLTNSNLDQTINTLPPEAPLAATPLAAAGIDQAIDQAFKPADNALLTSQEANPSTHN